MIECNILDKNTFPITSYQALFLSRTKTKNKSVKKRQLPYSPTFQGNFKKFEAFYVKKSNVHHPIFLRRKSLKKIKKILRIK